MHRGKLAAQAGHAYGDALWACLEQIPDRARSYQNGPGGSKVTLECRNLAQLQRAARECADAGIPHRIVEDSGHVLLPHFTGAKVVTALGIGPCTKAEARHITKRFQSVPAMERHVRESLLRSMRECEQTPGTTILQHGEMVRDRYRDLVAHIRDGKPLQGEWRLPGWAIDPVLLDRLLPDDVMAEYHLFHDVGKPFCRHVDADGRQHFQNHAAVSRMVWTNAGGSAEIGDLIDMDMDAHLLKGDGVEEFSSRTQACALLLTALAEVHANASMFGGPSSDGFKMKWKHLDRRGRAVLRAISARETPMAA